MPEDAVLPGAGILILGSIAVAIVAPRRQPAAEVGQPDSPAPVE